MEVRRCELQFGPGHGGPEGPAGALHQLGVGLGPAGRKQRDLVAAAHQLVGQRSDHSFCASVFGGRHCFVQWGHQSDTHDSYTPTRYCYARSNEWLVALAESFLRLADVDLNVTRFQAVAGPLGRSAVPLLSSESFHQRPIFDRFRQA